MTRLPRGIRGREFAVALRKLGYEPVRQTGSHIRLTTTQNGQHHVSIPAHDPLKVGTLNTILGMVADHFQMTRDELLDLLFG